MKPRLNKQTGKYEVEAFKETHEFSCRYEADNYCQEVMSFMFEEPIYLTDECECENLGSQCDA